MEAMYRREKERRYSMALRGVQATIREDRTVLIDARLFSQVQPWIDDFYEWLQRKPFRNLSIEVSGIRLYRECYEKLEQVIANLETLEELTLNADDIEALSFMAKYLHRARQIRKLGVSFDVFNRDFSLNDDPAFASALRGRQNVEHFETNNCTPKEIRMLSSVIPSLRKLREARFERPAGPSTSVKNDNHALSNDSFERLLSQSLTVLSICCYTIPVTSLQAIAATLGNNESQVSKLSFSYCKFPKEQGSLLAESLKHNTTLTGILFQCCKPDPSFFSSLKDGLSSNRTLTRFHMDYSNVSVSEADGMVLAVKANYSLVNFRLSEPPWIKQRNAFKFRLQEMSSIVRLNQAGRSYLLDDDASVRKGVEVLSQVSDDLDCLFLHLSENPKLCRPTGKKEKTVA